MPKAGRPSKRGARHDACSACRDARRAALGEGLQEDGQAGGGGAGEVPARRADGAARAERAVAPAAAPLSLVTSETPPAVAADEPAVNGLHSPPAEALSFTTQAPQKVSFAAPKLPATSNTQELHAGMLPW